MVWDPAGRRRCGYQSLRAGRTPPRACSMAEPVILPLADVVVADDCGHDCFLPRSLYPGPKGRDRGRKGRTLGGGSCGRWRTEGRSDPLAERKESRRCTSTASGTGTAGPPSSIMGWAIEAQVRVFGTVSTLSRALGVPLGDVIAIVSATPPWRPSRGRTGIAAGAGRPTAAVRGPIGQSCQVGAARGRAWAGGGISCAQRSRSPRSRSVARRT